MWILCASNNTQFVHLLPNKSYKVGRKEEENEIVLSNDKSISRHHATLNVNNAGQITVKDESKYGIFVNGNKITSNATLKHEDTIKFGVYDSLFTLEHFPILVCSSRLENDAQETLASVVKELNGSLVSQNWSKQCSHLVTESGNLTEKLTLALIDAKPIVSVSYFTALKKFCSAKSQTQKLPNISTFIIKPTEADVDGMVPELPSYAPNSKRSVLFQSKTFVFLDQKHFVETSKIVEAGGGSAVLEDGSIDEQFFQTHRTHCILVDEQKFSYTAAKVETLKKLGFETLRDTDLLGAILSVDLETYCSPRPPNASNVSLLKGKASEKPRATLAALSSSQEKKVKPEKLDSDEIVPPTTTTTKSQPQQQSKPAVEEQAPAKQASQSNDDDNNSQTQVRSRKNRPKKQQQQQLQPQTDEETASADESLAARKIKQQEPAEPTPEVSTDFMDIVTKTEATPDTYNAKKFKKRGNASRASQASDAEPSSSPVPTSNRQIIQLSFDEDNAGVLERTMIRNDDEEQEPEMFNIDISKKNGKAAAAAASKKRKRSNDEDEDDNDDDAEEKPKTRKRAKR